MKIRQTRTLRRPDGSLAPMHRYVEAVPTDAEVTVLARAATGFGAVGELSGDALHFNNREAALGYTSLLGFTLIDPVGGRLIVNTISVQVLGLRGQAVSVGANDSGGSGKRALVVDNA